MVIGATVMYFLWLWANMGWLKNCKFNGTVINYAVEQKAIDPRVGSAPQWFILAGELFIDKVYSGWSWLINDSWVVVDVCLIVVDNDYRWLIICLGNGW